MRGKKASTREEKIEWLSKYPHLWDATHPAIKNAMFQAGLCSSKTYCEDLRPTDLVMRAKQKAIENKLITKNMMDSNTTGGAQIEMPKYECHKTVHALKIAKIVRDGDGEDRETDGSAMITAEESAYAPFRVDADYMQKHDPQVGGYYVVYDDGYKSFSPAKAFEGGYTRVK